MQPIERPDLYEHQRQWLDSHAFWTAMVGPYGCGKTGAAILWAWERSRINWGRRGLWIEPTFGMIQDIVLPELEEFLDAMEIEEVLGGRRELQPNEYRLVRSQRPELELPWGVWMFRSAEVPRRLKGPTVAWAILDEADQMPQEVEDIVLSRVRDPRAAFHCIGHVGTPETFGSWLHERCEGDKRQASDAVIRAKQEDVTGLPPEYYQRMRDSYDPQVYEQYALGKWVLKAEGLIYCPPLSDANVRPCQYRKGEPVFVGMDFNVDPFSFACAQEVVNQTTGILEVDVFRQYRLKGATSLQAAETLRRDFPEVPVQIWCDAAGNSRHTSGISGSDVKILRDSGFDVHFTPVRRVNDRYNATRAMLCNANGERRLFFDPDACKQILREMHTLTYEEAAKAGADNHSTSALDYLTLGRYNPVWRDGMKRAS